MMESVQIGGHCGPCTALNSHQFHMYAGTLSFNGRSQLIGWNGMVLMNTPNCSFFLKPQSRLKKKVGVMVI